MGESPEIDKEIMVNGNSILLRQVKHTGHTPYNCYTTWNGTYRIIKSTLPVTQKDVEDLVIAGFFGCGQIVNARLVQEIHYNGICDSGG
jgi:hypothetical protein